MNILIACDKFRGSLEGLQVSEAIKRGILSQVPSVSITTSEIADGGEGSLTLLSKAYKCDPYEITVSNATGNQIKAKIGYNSINKTAVLEMASYVGLAQLAENERNPMKTSSYGLGQAIEEAIKKGAKKIIIGIGGSATNDGGSGMLHALGFCFFSKNGDIIYPKGGNLNHIERIAFPEKPLTENVEIVIASDVNNPVNGPEGATYTYGPQKGASKNDLETLESNLTYYAQMIKKMTGNDVFTQKSYGAAGGIPLSAVELLGAKVVSGSELIYQELGLAKKVNAANVVITGEGKIDHQTAQGKAISPLVKVAIENNKILHLVCGIYEDTGDNQIEIQSRFELVQLAKRYDKDSFKDAEWLCVEVGKEIGSTLEKG